jgi:hypothetical protein
VTYPTGVVRHDDGSFTLTAQSRQNADGSQATLSIPAGTPNPGAIMTQFFAEDLAWALFVLVGYPQDTSAAVWDGAMNTLS